MSRLRYGMQLPIQAQSTYFVEDWEKEAGAFELASVARACDGSGFDYVAVCDHVAIPRANASTMNTTWYDTVATLSWLAGITSNVRLLSHVYVPAYRHPLQTAKAFSTLDALSNGGGGVNALGRQAAAALLNAGKGFYPLSTAQVIADVQAAYADASIVESTKNLLEADNILGCPLN